MVMAWAGQIYTDKYLSSVSVPLLLNPRLELAAGWGCVWTYRLAELARNAALLACRIPSQRVLTSKAG